MKSLLCQTLSHHLGRIPSGQDYLDALVGQPAHWLVPLALELGWVGMDTSHAVIDAEGRLTGERVWLEDPVEDLVRKDAERLQKRNGCCMPAPAGVASASWSG